MPEKSWRTPPVGDMIYYPKSVRSHANTSWFKCYSPRLNFKFSKTFLHVCDGSWQELSILMLLLRGHFLCASHPLLDPSTSCCVVSCRAVAALGRYRTAFPFQAENNHQKFSNQVCVCHQIWILSRVPDSWWKTKRTTLKIINSILPVLVQATGEEESNGVKTTCWSVEFLKSRVSARFSKAVAAASSYQWLQ